MSLNAGMSEIQKFIIDNNIIGVTAGVCVALAAKDGIESFVGDIIIPTFVVLLRALHIGSLTKYLPTNKGTNFNITNFIKQMITFILIIIISFIFVRIAFVNVLGIDTSKYKKDKALTIEKFI